MQQLIRKQCERGAAVLEGALQSIFCLDIFFVLFINSQGIVNALVTPNGFFVKFQGASALCLLSDLCLFTASVSLLVALLTIREHPSFGGGR